MDRGQPIKQLAAGLGAAALLVTSATACTTSPELPTPPSPRPALDSSPTPEPDFDPEDIEAWTEVQTLFDGLMAVWIKWAETGVPGGDVDPAMTELGEYATTRFMAGDVYGELLQETRDGQVRTGRPDWQHTRLVSLDWENEENELLTPELVFEVCLDDDEWVVVDAATSEPAPGGPGGPHVWTVTAWWIEEREFGPDGWALYQREADRSRPC